MAAVEERERQKSDEQSDHQALVRFFLREPEPGTAKHRRDRNERQLIPLMAIAVADNDDENNHRHEPPTKWRRARIVSRDEDAEGGKCEKNGCQCAGACLKENMPIPAQAHDANATGAEKMIGIKTLRDPVGMPIPQGGRKERDQDNEP